MVDTDINRKLLKTALSNMGSPRFSFAILSVVSVSACKKGEGIVNGAVIKGPLQDALVFLD